jgi:hypothetical protein
MIFTDFRNGSQPCFNFLRIDKRVVQPPAEAAPPHGRHGFIENRKQGSGSPVILNRFEKFEFRFAVSSRTRYSAAEYHCSRLMCVSRLFWVSST